MTTSRMTEPSPLRSSVVTVTTPPISIAAAAVIAVAFLLVQERPQESVYATAAQTEQSVALPDGSTVTLGAVDCLHEPLARAIDAQGPSSRSSNMRLCVEGAEPGPCDMHTPTAKVGAVNTDPAFPADFQPVVMDWVLARLEDA